MQHAWGCPFVKMFDHFHVTKAVKSVSTACPVMAITTTQRNVSAWENILWVEKNITCTKLNQNHTTWFETEIDYNNGCSTVWPK